MTNIPPSSLCDRDLLIETQLAASSERRATASLLALMAEVDTRRLYLGEGFSSLFAYSTERLRLSEPAAYSRITAARAARRFPVLFSLLEEGTVSLTTVNLLAAHLTDENHASLLDAARHKSKRDVERLVAALQPQPDIASSVRALPNSRPMTGMAVTNPATPSALEMPELPTHEPTPQSLAATTLRSAERQTALVAPLGRCRYLIRMTISEETHDKLRQASDLLRHSIPDREPAAIFDRALTALLRQLLRTKVGAVRRPRSQKPGARRVAERTRHVPASVRREVWRRDHGRCAFVGSAGRCRETGQLEFHHVIPFAHGGPTTVDNVQLRCRAHNAYEGDLAFGDWRARVQPESGAGAANSVRTELAVAGDSS
jgi:5-methylcytosine-specific restriction endonuclease McrA